MFIRLVYVYLHTRLISSLFFKRMDFVIPESSRKIVCLFSWSKVSVFLTFPMRSLWDMTHFRPELFYCFANMFSNLMGEGFLCESG